MTVRPGERRPAVLVLAGVAAGLVVGGGGAAVGGALVNSKAIQDDSLRRVDLNFEVGQDASTLAAPVTLTKAQQDVLATTLNVDDKGASGVGQAFVELRNPTGQAATVTLLLVHLQDPDHTSTVHATLAPGDVTTVPVGLLCNGMPAGKQTVQLRAGGAAGVVVDSAFLSAIASPHT